MTERLKQSKGPHVSSEIIMQYAERHPRLRQWGRLLLVQGENQQPDLARAFLNAVEKFNMVVEASGNTFFNNLPGAGESLFSVGDLFLLSLPIGALGLSWDRCFEGLCVVGPSGSGKTTCASNVLVQMVDKGFSVLFFDQKTEVRHLINHPVVGDKVTVLQVEDFQISLFQPIVGVRDEVVIASTTDLLGKAMGKLSAQYLLLDIVRDIRAKNIVGRDEGIPLSVLEEAVRQLRYVGRRTSELKESLLQGLAMLRSRLGTVLEY